MTDPTYLPQWTKGAAPALHSDAKLHEFSVYIPPLLALLKRADVHDVVDFQADEGRVAKDFCAMNPVNHAAFVLIPDDEIALKKTQEVTAGNRRIELVTSLADIENANADAILFNNILGCQGTLANIEEILGETQGRSIVRPAGYAAVTAPNVDGRRFSSYACSNLPPDRTHGENYDFLMKGAEGAFVNLYLTEGGLTSAFARHGFALIGKQDVADQPYEGFASRKPAFRQYLFQNNRPA